ncbi:hypothetical protein, partial [Flavobacterium johnsoniae]|uniref:hypothetical protein n=1 Tax=Flavobacterium johnsoniae TaxID=986 RepID=UPI003394A6BF
QGEQQTRYNGLFVFPEVILAVTCLVENKNTADGVSISVNDENRVVLNLGGYNLGSERITSFSIGNVLGNYNQVRIGTKRSVFLFSTRQVTAKITSGNTNRPLYLVCCSPC